MPKEIKKCKNCYFEDGEHSFECEHREKEQPKDWDMYKNNKLTEMTKTELIVAVKELGELYRSNLLEPVTYSQSWEEKLDEIDWENYDQKKEARNALIKFITNLLKDQEEYYKTELEKLEFKKWEKARAKVIKDIEMLIVDEINIARNEGEKTSRLTSLIMGIKDKLK